MKRVIFKYTLGLAERAYGLVVHLPSRREDLDVQIQDGRLVLWSVVDPRDSAPTDRRIVDVFYTGELFPDDYDPSSIKNIHRTHLASLQRSDGIVLHVFLRQ